MSDSTVSPLPTRGAGPGLMPDLDVRFEAAIAHYWEARRAQKKKQEDAGTIDTGTRSAVTGNTQMGALEVLASDILTGAGLEGSHVRIRTALELPSYYRPEKRWDLLVVANKTLICAVEFKSQVGPSFGNNFNNRVEEAIGNATDLWTAFREGWMGTSAPRPILGYFFLLEDCPAVHTPVRNTEPFFPVDPDLKGVSYAKRYEMFCRRLVSERLYDVSCLTLSKATAPHDARYPSPDLTFRRFAAELDAAARRFVSGSG